MAQKILHFAPSYFKSKTLNLFVFIICGMIQVHKHYFQVHKMYLNEQ